MSLITNARLKQDLINCGLKTGDVVMLHASIKAIGELVGGPDIVINSIMEIITHTGTLMMYIGWEDSPYHLAEWSLAKQQAYLNELPAFNINNSRAKRDHGILAEFFRTTPGVLRSQNPGASVCALGKEAEFITKEHPLNYGYGIGSPFQKLCQLNGKILVLGSSLAHITLYHYSECLCKVPKKRIVKWSCPIIQNNKITWIEIEEYDSSQGIVTWDGDYFPLITDDYIKKMELPVCQVGNARTFLFDAKQLNDFAVEWMEEKFSK